MTSEDVKSLINFNFNKNFNFNFLFKNNKIYCKKKIIVI